jgi:hypothetical protein
MADLSGQIEQARKVGYSDAEIAGFLKQKEPKVAKALESGYQPQEVLAYLTRTAAPAGQIPGAAPGMVAPPATEIPVGRRAAAGAGQNVGMLSRIMQPSAEMLAGFEGARRGAQVAAPLGPVGRAVGTLGGGIAGFVGARGVTEALQGQQPNLPAAAEEAVQGEVIGRGAGALLRGVKRVAEPLSTMAERRATNVAQQAAGRDIEDIRGALQAADAGMTPAQATAQSPRQAWQSLLAFEPTDFAADVARRQKDLAQSQLGALAGGTSQTAARESAEAGKRELRAQTAPLRETELAAANEAQRAMSALVPRRDQKQASMVSALQQAGKTGTEAAQRAGAAAQQLQRVAQRQPTCLVTSPSSAAPSVTSSTVRLAVWKRMACARLTSRRSCGRLIRR